jgi:hypothetical protein
MDLAKHYLEVIGCEASGIISDEDPVKGGMLRDPRP